MDIKEMQVADIEARMSEIETEMNADGANLEELSAEVDALIERKNQIKTAAEEKRALLDKVANMKTAPVETIEEREVEQMMDVKEYRNTKEYIDAFAEYVKTGNDAECRALLTENVGTGTVVVPEFVETKVMTAWENDEIMNRVRKTFIKGNLKVNFEISGTDAVVHVEGSGEVDPETLTLGMVKIVPQNIKKWIPISDEVYAMGGEEFLDYIYDELNYRLVKKAANLVIAAITAAPAVSSASTPGVRQFKEDLSAGTIARAESLLSAEATDVVAIMSRTTWGALKALQITSGQNVGDVFDGLPVIFNDSLTGEQNVPYIIVGDLKGVTINFPEGDDVKFKFDETTKMTEDIIRVLGKVYAGIAVTAPYRFTAVYIPD
jgi:HK97 family phage major capsid protein